MTPGCGRVTGSRVQPDNPGQPFRLSQTLFARGADCCRPVRCRPDRVNPSRARCRPKGYGTFTNCRSEPLERAEPTPTKHPPIRPCCARCPGLTGLRRNHLPVAWHVPKGRPVPGCRNDRATVHLRKAPVTEASLAPWSSPTFCHADPGINPRGYRSGLLVQVADISLIPKYIGGNDLGIRGPATREGGWRHPRWSGPAGIRAGGST